MAPANNGGLLPATLRVNLCLDQTINVGLPGCINCQVVEFLPVFTGKLRVIKIGCFGGKIHMIKPRREIPLKDDGKMLSRLSGQSMFLLILLELGIG